MKKLIKYSCMVIFIFSLIFIPNTKVFAKNIDADAILWKSIDKFINSNSLEYELSGKLTSKWSFIPATVSFKGDGKLLYKEKTGKIISELKGSYKFLLKEGNIYSYVNTNYDNEDILKCFTDLSFTKFQYSRPNTFDPINFVRNNIDRLDEFTSFIYDIDEEEDSFVYTFDYNELMQDAYLDKVDDAEVKIQVSKDDSTITAISLSGRDDDNDTKLEIKIKIKKYDSVKEIRVPQDTEDYSKKLPKIKDFYKFLSPL